MTIKKIIYIALGCLSVGLGAIGAVVPILPTVPFLILSTICFARSSERLHTWFVGTKLYKNNLESFVKGKGMTMKTKLRIIAIVTGTMAVGFFAMSRVPIGRIILSIVWIFHLAYFAFCVKTSPIQEGSK